MISIFGLTLEPRKKTSIPLQTAAILVGLVAAFLVSAALIATAGANVFNALGYMFKGAYGDWDAFVETLVQATPLIFTGLAIVVAFRAKVFNIGAEGQFFAGAMASTWIGLHLTGLPGPVVWVLIIIGSIIAGGIWGFIPGILKATLGASEIITTVMLNYVILYIISYLLSGPWREPDQFYLQTAWFPDHCRFPAVVPLSRLHLGFIISLVLAAVVYLLLWKTPFGFEIRSIGINPRASRYKGIRIKKTLVLVMVISGAIAGLGGGSEIAGLHQQLRLDISTGYGYTAIIIALLGRLHPVGVIIVAIFFGGLVNGSTSMQINTGVPVALVHCIQGVVLIFVLTAEVLATYRIRRTEIDE